MRFAAAVAKPKWPSSPGRVSRPFVALVGPLGLLLLWSISARNGWLPPQILPSPADVGPALRDLARSGDLVSDTAISLLRVVEGFAAGACFGLLLGVAMGLSSKIEDYVKPLLTAFAQVPTLGWIPFLMLLVGIGEPLKILVIAKAAVVPVTLNTFVGIRAVPYSYAEVGALFRFSRWQLLRRVMLPAADPGYLHRAALRADACMERTRGVELLASAEGLGYLLVWGRHMFWLDMMIAAMLVIGIVGCALDWAMAAVESWLQRWRLA